MATVEEYIVKNNMDYKYVTYNKDSSQVYILDNKSLLLLNGFYNAGYIKCVKDIYNLYEESLNSSTQFGGYNMDIDRILDHLVKLDDKYDKKIDMLSNKLDNVIDSLNKLNREVGEIKTDVDNIDKRSSFWKSYIMAPIITSVITAILVKIIG